MTTITGFSKSRRESVSVSIDGYSRESGGGYVYFNVEVNRIDTEEHEDEILAKGLLTDPKDVHALRVYVKEPQESYGSSPSARQIFPKACAKLLEQIQGLYQASRDLQLKVDDSVS